MAKAAKITDRMFVAAAKALSDLVTDAERDQGRLLPAMENIREVSARVAAAVAVEARDAGLGRLLSDEELGQVIRAAQWEPRFVQYRSGTPGR